VIFAPFAKVKEKAEVKDATKAEFLVDCYLLPHYSKSCTELILDCCQLRELPDSIGLFVHLTTFSVRGNQLTVLPVQVGNLFSLKTFDCSDNQLRALPQEISCLRRLERLLIHSNSITTLPDSFVELLELVELNMFDNKMIQPHSVLGSYKTMTKLNLAHNPIMQIRPITTIGWGNVKILNIFDCRIVYLPSFAHLNALEELRAGENNLQTVPDFGTSCRHLKLLELHKNSIREVPQSFFPTITNVRRLSLGYNLLEVLPTHMRLQKLERFCCNNNKLKLIPETIGFLPALKVLCLEYNWLIDLPASLVRNRTLKRVNLARNPGLIFNRKCRNVIDHLQAQCKSVAGIYVSPDHL